jgi:hypothetical protein
MKILTQFDGWALIALFFVVMSAIVLCLRKRTQTKAEFLAAGHSAPWLLTAFSMAATWVWAPSMFTAADDMAGTVTFNRARGTHLLEPMEHIVKKLLDEGLQVDEISKKLGMSREEIFRLSKIDRETFLKLVTSRGDQKFSKAQVIRRG